MTVYHWILLVSIAFCLSSFLFWFLRLRKKPAKDFAEPKGEIRDGIAYSCTVAMMPQNKESAYLHLPTYVAGIVFHLGIFASILLIILQMIFPSFLASCRLGSNVSNSMFILEYYKLWSWMEWVRIILGFCLCVSSLCGLFILIKRFVNKELRYISNVDDYLSNIIITHFQIASACSMLFPLDLCIKAWAFIAAAIVCFYLPFGKLRHVFYFISARIELGKFFGSRGVWSLKNKKK